MIGAKLSPIRMVAKIMYAQPQTGLFSWSPIGLGRAGSSKFAFYNRENQLTLFCNCWL